MSATLFKASALFSALALVSQVSAHGIVHGIVVDGKWYRGYEPWIEDEKPKSIVAGWSVPSDTDWSFVNDYQNPDIICHRGATPGGTYIKVAAGGKINLQWNVWDEGHKGPMLDYLANCWGDCQKVDKTQLLWNKIDEDGMRKGDPVPGYWASDDMRSNNVSWDVTIPSWVAPGKYVLRHETIALHQADRYNGAQNYPQCINLEITGSGSDSLQGGTKGTELYHVEDPGLDCNIWYPALKNYTIPGPPLYKPGNSKPASSAAPAPAPSSSAWSSSAAPAPAPSTPASSWSSEAATYSTWSSAVDAATTSTSSASSSASTSEAWSSAYESTWAETTVTATSTGPTGTTTETSTTTTFVTVSPQPTFSWGDWSSSSAVVSSASSASSLSSVSSASSVAPAPPASTPASSSSSKPAKTWGWGKPQTQVVSPLPASSASTPAPAPVSPATKTSVVSFTSTITGRIGKETKFTCYVEL